MFRDAFKETEDNFTFNVERNSLPTLVEAEALDILKNSKIKVKNIIPTKWGTEVIFFNAKDAQEAAKLVDAEEADGSSILIKN